MGKTSILTKYIKNEFSLDYKVTLGIDFLNKEISKNNMKINLQIWDTAGSEKYKSLLQSYYRNTEICVLTFDLTNINSFKNVEKWYKDFINISNIPEKNDFPFVLFGNKSDLIDDIKVKEKEVKKFCVGHNNMPYFFVSAKDGKNIEQSFEKIGDIAYNIIINKNKEDLPERKYLSIQKKKNHIFICTLYINIQKKIFFFYNTVYIKFIIYFLIFLIY